VQGGYGAALQGGQGDPSMGEGEVMTVNFVSAFLPNTGECPKWARGGSRVRKGFEGKPKAEPKPLCSFWGGAQTPRAAAPSQGLLP